MNCTARCRIAYHLQCWKDDLDKKNIKNEKTLLDTKCLTPDCWGKVSEIVWIDSYGEELPRRLSMTPTELLKSKQKHSKVKINKNDELKPRVGKLSKKSNKESKIEESENQKELNS